MVWSGCIIPLVAHGPIPEKGWHQHLLETLICLWHSDKGLVKQAYPHISMKIWHATAGSCLHNILSQSTVMYGFNPIHKLVNHHWTQNRVVLFMFILYTFELHWNTCFALASSTAKQLIDSVHTVQGDFPYTQDPDQKLWQRMFFWSKLTQLFDMFGWFSRGILLKWS